MKIYTDGPREPDVDVVTLEGLGPSVEGDAGIGSQHSLHRIYKLTKSAINVILEILASSADEAIQPAI